MTDTVLLTGVTGFLGGHITLELLKAGYMVRGSLRNPDPADPRRQKTRAALEAAGGDVSRLEFVSLDLTKDEGWEEAAQGARYVMHVASPFVTTMPKDPQVLIKPAVEGTQRAWKAAVSAGAERVVVTSSTRAVVDGRKGMRKERLGPQDWTDYREGEVNAYSSSKVLAERRAWELAGTDSEGGPALSVINPGFICGPLLDNDPGTSVAILLRLLRGELPAAPQLYMHLVDVRDLAQIHVAALQNPEAVGHRHPAAFSTFSIFEIAQVLKDAFPQYAAKLPKRELPNWITRLVGVFDGDVRTNISELGYCPKLDVSAARALLGREPIAGEQSLKDAVSSLIEKKLI